MTDPELTKGNAVEVMKNAYDACANSHAVVVCTEWDEFQVHNHQASNQQS